MSNEPKIATKQHEWREISVVPVHVIGELGDGYPATATLDEPRVGTSCAVCCQPLNAETASAECPGPYEGP